MTEQNESREPIKSIYIVGINIGILAVYTLISALWGGLFLDTIMIAVHVLACFIIYAEKRRGVWILSGLIVLLIGFSSCVNLLFN